MVSLQQQRIDALKAMLKDNPNDPFALYGLALEYKATGAIDDAIELLKRAVDRDQPEPYAFYQLGELSHAAGKSEAARTALERGLEVAEERGEMKAYNELKELLSLVGED